MKNFVKINEKLAKSTIFYKLETNFIYISRKITIV